MPLKICGQGCSRVRILTGIDKRSNRNFHLNSSMQTGPVASRCSRGWSAIPAFAASVVFGTMWARQKSQQKSNRVGIGRLLGSVSDRCASQDTGRNASRNGRLAPERPRFRPLVLPDATGKGIIKDSSKELRLSPSQVVFAQQHDLQAVPHLETLVQKCCSEIEQASWGSLGLRIPNSPVKFGSHHFRNPSGLPDLLFRRVSPVLRTPDVRIKTAKVLFASSLPAPDLSPLLCPSPAIPSSDAFVSNSAIRIVQLPCQSQQSDGHDPLPRRTRGNTEDERNG